MLRIAAVLSIAAATGYGLGELTDSDATASIARPELKGHTLLPPVIVVPPRDRADGPAAAAEYTAYR